MKKYIAIFLIVALFSPFVFADLPANPLTPEEQFQNIVNEKLLSLDAKMGTMIQAQMDLGRVVAEDMNTLVSQEKFDQADAAMNQKMDKKIEMPILITAIIINDMFVVAIYLYFKMSGKV